MNQRKNRKQPLIYLPIGVPPSSPPINALLAISTMKQTIATQRKTMTEKASGPAFTKYPFESI